MVRINVGKFSNLDKLSSQLSKSEVPSFLGNYHWNPSQGTNFLFKIELETKLRDYPFKTSLGSSSSSSPESS
jgi:hypothetical protein